jgi:hypothetical protein
MTNRRLLLQVSLSMALVLSLIVPASLLNIASAMAQGAVTPMVAAGVGHTVGLKSDGTVVAVGFNDYGQCDVGGWNLGLAAPPSQEGQGGIKAGDWIKIGYNITGWPADQPCAEWLKLEFLSVEGTSANVRVTMHISDGTEQSTTVPVNLAEGGGEAFGLPGFFISPNMATGDSVYIMAYGGDVTIEGETTRTYAGARRRVVYASLLQSLPPQDEFQLTYYWDKQTGVMVETYETHDGVTTTGKVTETNMWKATSTGMPWWPWVIVAAVAVGLVIFFVRRRRRGPADTSG